jgi:hypothetical protein
MRVTPGLGGCRKTGTRNCRKTGTRNRQRRNCPPALGGRRAYLGGWWVCGTGSERSAVLARLSRSRARAFACRMSFGGLVQGRIRRMCHPHP